jgi:glutamine synthetase
MYEALTYFRESALMKEALGDVIHEKFVENKIFEMDQFNRHITDYELNTYLSKL